MIDIERFLDIVEQEVQHYRVPVVDLIGVQTSDPFRVLIATILSARTKDEVTAVASERLFSRAEDAAQLADLEQEEIQNLIYPVGFYKNKAAQVKKCCRLLVDKYQGRVPETLEELVTLPGVGRKTANLVLSVAFDIPAICVDTHVHRIMNIWKRTNSLLVAFGQGVCRPVAPHCDRCVIQADCPQIGVVPRKR